MKHIPHLLAGIFCLSSLVIAAQTLELENRFLDQLEATGKTNKKEIKARREKIAELLTAADYPKVAYDTASGNFDFRFTIPAPGATKADLYRQIREWSALTFIRNGAGVQFQDSLAGSVVIRGYTDLIPSTKYPFVLWNATQYRYALKLTAKDGVVEGQFRSVEFVTPPDTSDSGAIVEYRRGGIMEYTQRLSSFFPISSTYHAGMEKTANLVKWTAADFKKVELDLKNYLSGDSR